jgi:hypothetical protein
MLSVAQNIARTGNERNMPRRAAFGPEIAAGGYALYRIQTLGAPTIMEHITGIAIGAAVHGLIVAYALRRRSRAQIQFPEPIS